MEIHAENVNLPQLILVLCLFSRLRIQRTGAQSSVCGYVMLLFFCLFVLGVIYIVYSFHLFSLLFRFAAGVPESGDIDDIIVNIIYHLTQTIDNYISIGNWTVVK